MLNLDNRHPDIALNLTNIGAIHSKKNDFEKALDYYKRSMDQRFETLGAEHDKTALSMINYGAVLAKLTRKDEALDYYKRALKVYIKIFGENHAKTIALQKKMSD
jgi:tetratricopeptide (TPR) repeat protein